MAQAQLERIPTSEVRVGDRIACLLSDAQAYPVITGWTDHTIDLTRHNLGTYTYRTFEVQSCPWWAKDDLSHDLDGETLIVARGTELPKPSNRPSLETLEEWAMDGVAEATDGCEVEPDGSCEHGAASWLLVLGVI